VAKGYLPFVGSERDEVGGRAILERAGAGGFAPGSVPWVVTKGYVPLVTIVRDEVGGL
jgi:hypothetical protein